jgi:methylenetetrahydrofolate reductase (NADPH)
MSYLTISCFFFLTGITRETADDLLVEAARAGIRSILVLRGDPPPTAGGKWEPTPKGFANATELVSHVRSKHGSFFSIAVAGHPLGHPSSATRAVELTHLKAKVDAGADYIITQMFFEAAQYTSYVRECRGAGITCPIVPGILMVPPSVPLLRQVIAHCRVPEPTALVAAMVAAGEDSEAIRVAGRVYMEGVCREILRGDSDAAAPGIYIYTMNLEKSARELVANLELKGLNQPEDATAQRPLPFARPRDNEKVRPIFWASNPVSFLARTRGWVNDMPQTARELVLEALPAFDDEAHTGGAAENAQRVVYSYHSIVARRMGSKAERRSMWGECLNSDDDVFDVFERFVRGYVPRLPWCEGMEKVKETLL